LGVRRHNLRHRAFALKKSPTVVELIRREKEIAIPMAYTRIIPRLDIKGPNLVKGIHLEGLRVLGKPESFAAHYYENGADELIYVDVVASLYGRNSLLDIVERTAEKIFIPLTVAGGLRSIDDIKAVLRAGADKVALNTAAIANPELIREASRKFGSSTIVVSIETLKRTDGTYECFTDNGREETGIDPFSWARQVTELGAGEILLTSIDQEGTGKGYDLELTRGIAKQVPIPVIACGGAGSTVHIETVITTGKADAVSLSSLLHYQTLETLVESGDYSQEGNTEFLNSGRDHSHISPVSLAVLKKTLVSKGIRCRYSRS